MELSIWTEERRRKTVRTGGWILAGIALFYAAVCTPVYLWSVSDVVIADTAFPAVWDMVQQLVHYCFYWTAFAFLIYLAARYTLRACRGFLFWYAACAAVRYAASLAVSSAMLAGSAGWDSLGSDLLYMLLDILLDCVQMALAVLFVYLLLERRRGPEVWPSVALPRLFGLKNPVLRAALFSVLLPSGIQLLNRLYYDIFFFGSPQNAADLVSMIFFYLMDIVSIPVGYMVVFLLISRLNLKDEEARAHVVEQTPGGDF